MGVNPLLTGMPFLYMYVRGYQNALLESKHCNLYRENKT